MSKEIKVQLKRTMDDNYNELWKVVGEKSYYARHVFNEQGFWYYVCDPFGYCELDHLVDDGVTFIVCDSKGNELFRNGNSDEYKPFSTLEATAKSEWSKVKNDKKLIVFEENEETDFWAVALNGAEYSTLSVNKWLLTFKDIEKYGKSADDYAENWIYCRKQELSKKSIHEFEYLGDKFAVYEVRYRHTICGEEWIEYYSGSIKMGEYENYIAHYGSWFDTTKVGTVYPEGVAIEIIKEALKEKYNSDVLSVVDMPSWTETGIESKSKIRIVAKDMLMNKEVHRTDLSKKNVEKVLQHIKDTKEYYASFDDIKKDYPKCRPDYNFRDL